MSRARRQHCRQPTPREREIEIRHLETRKTTVVLFLLISYAFLVWHRFWRDEFTRGFCFAVSVKAAPLFLALLLISTAQNDINSIVL